MQVVDLADELHLSTADAVEICVAAGVADAGATTELTRAEAERARSLARTRERWLEHPDREPVGAGRPPFGALPPAPWERGAGAPAAGTPAPPALHPTEPDPLGPGWGAGTDSPHGSVSPYAPAALALAVVSLIFPFVPAFGALALAWYAKNRIERSGGRETGERLATAAQVVAGVGIGLWALLLAFTIYRDVRDDAAARDDGQVEVGVLAWDQISSGDCVRVPRADLAVGDWTELDCGEPHEAEVFATERVAPTTNPDEPYPGRDSLVPGATRYCQEQFVDYVGVPYEASALRIAVYFPTASNWVEHDDRTIGCIVFQEDHQLIVGSLRQSGR